jgi:hypothetical protein
MFSALVDFIFTGNPNSGPFNQTLGTSWEKYDPVKRNMIHLSEPEVQQPHVQGVRESQCKFWENFQFVFPESMMTSTKSSSSSMMSVTALWSMVLVTVMIVAY